MKPKRVIFVEPMPSGAVSFSYFLRKWPMLGCLTMATMLRDRGHSVTVYDENLTGSVLDDAEAFAEMLNADFVGLTALTSSISRAYTIAGRLKQERMKGKLAIGGPHVTFMFEEALQYFDCVVRGEADTVITRLVEDDEAANGIIVGEHLADLDMLPTPDFRLIHRHEQLWKRSILNGCKYCAVTKMYGRRYRFRSPQRVMEDLRFYCDQGFRTFFFYDDNFTANHARSKELMRMMCGLRIRWNAQTRVDFPWADPNSRTKVDTELMKLMEASGVHQLFIGYETIDDATAKSWDKGYKGDEPLAARLAQDTALINSMGTRIHGMFVLGPQHGVDTMAALVEFGKGIRLDSFQMSILTPFPGTEIMEAMRGDLIFRNFPDDWRYFDGAHLTFHHKKAGNRAIHEALVQYHVKFYLSLHNQFEALRRLVIPPRDFGRKIVRLAQDIVLVRRTLNNWKADNVEFLSETARRGGKYLLPEE